MKHVWIFLPYLRSYKTEQNVVEVKKKCVAEFCVRSTSDWGETKLPIFFEIKTNPNFCFYYIFFQKLISAYSLAWLGWHPHGWSLGLLVLLVDQGEMGKPPTSSTNTTDIYINTLGMDISKFWERLDWDDFKSCGARGLQQGCRKWYICRQQTKISCSYIFWSRKG